MAFENFSSISDKDPISTSIASDIINLIRRFEGKSKIDISLQYRSLANSFIHLQVSRDGSPSGLNPWESVLFKRKGFVLDANSYVPAQGSPGISLDIVIDPETEPQCLEKLEYSILDSIRHEIEHTGISNPSNTGVRQDHETSYRYFLLSDEIPAMVSGLKLSARREGVSLATAISDYLTPFVESGFMSVPEFDEGMHAWLDYANSL